MLYNFCTLFDRNYATRGLALYRSLERQCAQNFRLTILCIDEETRDVLARLQLPHARLWLAEDLGDAELLEVRKTRPRREFCWTCAAPLMLAMLREAQPGKIVTYVDADLAFFSDPLPIFEELGLMDILIHRHDFAPRHSAAEAASGIFNVGVIAIRNSAEGMACLTRWRAQNIEMCVLDPERGYCGDQKYLDEWPDLYERLVIASHPGIGLAPWNTENHAITKVLDTVMVDGRPLVFYHYHALSIVLAGKWRRWIVIPSLGYRFTAAERNFIYKPYVRMLRSAQRDLALRVFEIARTPVGARQLVSWLRRLQLVIA